MVSLEGWERKRVWERVSKSRNIRKPIKNSREDYMVRSEFLEDDFNRKECCGWTRMKANLQESGLAGKVYVSSGRNDKCLS